MSSTGIDTIVAVDDMRPWRRYTGLEFDEACFRLTPRRIGGLDPRSSSARHVRALDRALEVAAGGDERCSLLDGGVSGGLGGFSFEPLAFLFGSFTFSRLSQHRGELLDRAQGFGGRCLRSSSAGHDPESGSTEAHPLRNAVEELDESSCAF